MNNADASAGKATDNLCSLKSSPVSRKKSEKWLLYMVQGLPSVEDHAGRGVKAIYGLEK